MVRAAIGGNQQPKQVCAGVLELDLVGLCVADGTQQQADRVVIEDRSRSRASDPNEIHKSNRQNHVCPDDRSYQHKSADSEAQQGSVSRARKGWT